MRQPLANGILLTAGTAGGFVAMLVVAIGGYELGSAVYQLGRAAYLTMVGG